MSQFESQFEEDLYRARLEKLERIADLSPALSRAEARYPNHFRFSPPGIDVPTIKARFEPLTAEQLDQQKPLIAIAGRLVAIRLQGKAGFAQLQQGGQRLQIYVRKDTVGDTAFELYKLLDLGDHIGVEGYLFRTRTNELTLHVEALTPGNAPITFLAKALLPLPDKHSGLGDIELRYRRRYLDLFTDTGDFAEPTQQTGTPSENGPQKTSGIPSETGPQKTSGTPSETGPQKTSGTPSETGPQKTSLILSETGPQKTSLILSETGPQKTSGIPNETGPQKKSVILSEGAGQHPAPQSKDPHEPSAQQASQTLSTTELHQTRLPARDVFVKRAAILRSIRNFFDTRGYLEVETPMLHTVAGGAAARPFSTHHNALDIPLSLRIAPELYLKRLVVGGLDRVYEINRNFRNEGVSTQHNPEFTMLEFYQAYANYHDLMDLTQELITTVAKDVNGTTIANFSGAEINLSKWTKLSMCEAVVRYWPDDLGEAPTADEVKTSIRSVLLKGIKHQNPTYPDWISENERILPVTNYDAMVMPDGERRFISIATQRKIQVLAILMDDLGRGKSHGKIIAEVFELFAEEHLFQPHIIYDFPLAVSPLSKIKPDEPDWVERFEFYIGGFEVGNAFSELNDPADQLARFEAQVADKDPESMAAVDEDYVRALGYGLPPTAGEGIGIDRLTMILTGSRSIRDVILFPLMRPPKPTLDQESDQSHGESAE